MNRIEELIQQLCPDGVEWKKIKDVYRRIKGTPITAGKRKEIQTANGEIKIFAGGKTIVNAKETAIPNANITRVPAVLVQSRGVIDVVYFEEPFTFKNEMWAYTSNEQISVKYLYYVLKNSINYFRDMASGMGSLPQISLPVTEDFQIPIPPLAIQNEIVNILDLFTRLEAELEAELEARKMQYSYYRDTLLNFEGKGVEWKTLGDIGKVCMCKRVMKHETSLSGEIPFFKIGTFGKNPDAYITKKLYEYYKKKYPFPKVGDVLISASGTIGRTVIYNGYPAYFQDSNIVWVDNNEKYVMNKFLYYFYKIVEWRTDGGTISRLYNDNLAKTKIPIPPLSEQERIVGILDKFDALVNDLSSGLPAEIRARRQQYEYYRDQLLTFKNRDHG